ncbi:MAG: hypothetical protein QOE03_3306 [Micromonosporaceae bacterium]|nr:hypothetical protein [Micromonosporaceae bacterium]
MIDHHTSVPLLDTVAGELVGSDHTRLPSYPAPHGADPVEWLSRSRESVDELLSTHGAVLLRDLPVEVALFERLVRTVGGDLLEYTERSTPRSAVHGRVYTSTEYPAAEEIPMHNESSYSERYPRLLFFLCHTAAATGGATPIADGRAVWQQLPEPVRERLRPGIIYTRTYRRGVGLSWQESFQTQDRAVVERYCREHGIDVEWRHDDLHTRHRRPAFLTDPSSGAQLWFNQANLFHVTALADDLREALLEMYGEDGLPRNAYLADGTPIGEADLAAVRHAFDTVRYAVPWRAGDFLMVNNLLAAHGRLPFTGERRVLVAMTG